MFITSLTPLYFLTSIIVPTGGYKPEKDGRRCEPVTISLCSEMKYNTTIMPNMVGQMNQKDADANILEFLPLIQFGCSPLLKFFLCSMYAPMCTEQVDETMLIPPCRSMCLEVKSKCEPVMRKFQYKWPSVLDCSKLSEKSDRHNLCIEPPVNDELLMGEEGGDEKEYGGTFDLSRLGFIPEGVIQSEEVQSLLKALRAGPLLEKDNNYENFKRGKNAYNFNEPLINLGVYDKYRGTVAQPPFIFVSRLGRKCGHRYVHVDKLTNEKNNFTCAPLCFYDVFYRIEDKKLVEVWMIIWSTISFISTTFTLITFLLDTSRINYPEKPIIFLCFTNLFYSIGYLIRIFVGASLACDQTKSGIQYLIQDGLENLWCITVFIFLYFFGMSCSIWWVVLTFTFYLSSSKTWSAEAIGHCSNYFHAAAWAIPAVKTVVIIALRKVDGDELTGLCYVGNNDTNYLIFFVVIPLSIYFSIGTVFLLAGFLAMFRIRRNLMRDGTTNIRKLEQLMAKMGIISILYTLPTICVICSFVYQVVETFKWQNIAFNNPCFRVEKSNRLLDCSLERSLPNVEVFMLKIFMFLIIGTVSATWVLSPKTLQTWKVFMNKVRGCINRKNDELLPETNINNNNNNNNNKNTTN